MITCPSCNQESYNKYCPHCGEKLVREGDYSTWSFIKKTFGDVANLDSRFYRSFRKLILKPGHLTVSYFKGQRIPFLRPVQIFVLANVIYFLVQPFTIYTGFNTTLDSQMRRQIYSHSLGLEQRVLGQVEAKAITFEQYEAIYNTKSSTYAKSFIFTMIPLFALFTLLLFGRSRRYYVEHLVFSVHYYAWSLFFLFSIYLLIWGWILVGAYEWFARDLIDNASSEWVPLIADFLMERSSAVLEFVYLYFASRSFFREARWKCIIKSLLLVQILLYITYFYRMLLFWITYLTV